MTREARLLSGIILITIPTIQYGGYFLLTSLIDKGSGYMDNPLRQNFFRAGHAHAGVIVILSLWSARSLRMLPSFPRHWSGSFESACLCRRFYLRWLLLFCAAPDSYATGGFHPRRLCTHFSGWLDPSSA